MGSLDIEQAARASGLTARDVRLLIEHGRLPATRPSGRWLIDQRHLAAAAPRARRPSVAGARPIGADQTPEVHQPGRPGRRRPRHRAGAAGGGQAQIADLRVERDELRLRLREQVSSLQHSLEDSMEELDDARARIAELESRRPAARARRRARASARDALTPLFRATTQLRDVGQAPDAGSSRR